MVCNHGFLFMRSDKIVPPEVHQARERLLARKHRSFARHQVFVTEGSEADRKILYEYADSQGLLLEYDFAGIRATGVSRRDAITNLMQSTFERAFELLRRNFGSSAKFHSRPKRFKDLEIDFYWKRADFGLVISGPNIDDLWRPGNQRTRDRNALFERWAYRARSVDRESQRLAVMMVPYYEIWHHPTEFAERVRNYLRRSGQYPRV